MGGTLESRSECCDETLCEFLQDSPKIFCFDCGAGRGNTSRWNGGGRGDRSAVEDKAGCVVNLVERIGIVGEMVGELSKEPVFNAVS